MDTSFYEGRRVLITGHTGFKGTWLTRILVNAGANVLGYSRCSEKDPSFFDIAGVQDEIVHVRGDVRDYVSLLDAFTTFRPEIVFHLAAQPIVQESYIDLQTTYDPNIMCHINVLEPLRQTCSVKSVVVVTTHNLYRNDEAGKGFREGDVLDGFDPYGNSKSCVELVIDSYRRGLPVIPPISMVQVGNVIGGGDYSKGRIIPDCVKAMRRKESIYSAAHITIGPFNMSSSRILLNS